MLVCLFLAGPTHADETPAQAAPSPMEFLTQLTRAQLATGGFERKEATVEDRKTVWWQRGTGPTVVMVHGVSDQAGTWFQVAPRLAETYRVLLVDLPGHGESEPADGPLKMSTVLEGFEAWLHAHAGDEPVILVGNSMGAWISSLVALRNPETVSLAVLVNGGPLRADTGDLDLIPADREEARRLMAALRDPKSPPTPDPVLDDLVRRAQNGHVKRMLDENEDLESRLLTPEQMKTIEPKVHVLWGESDRYMGRDYPDRLLKGFGDAELTLIPECGHIPQVECAAPFYERLSSILAAPVDMPKESSPSEDSSPTTEDP